MIYRTGRHNPHTLYAADNGGEPRGRGEMPIGFISDEAMAMLAAEAMTASACPACPMACASCSRNRATCECYEHQDNVDEDGQPVEGSTPVASPARPCGMHYSWSSHGTVAAGTLGPCVLDVADHHERHRDGYGNEWLNVQWALQRLDVPPDMRSRRQGGRGVAAGYPPAFPEEAAYWTDDADGDPIIPAPAGEVVSVPPPVTEERLRAALHAEEHDHSIAYRRDVLGEFPPDAEPPAAGEPAPVPPPVDALLELIDEYGEERGQIADARSIGFNAGVRLHTGQAAGYLREATAKINALWAAGVSEGRRQAEDEFDNWRTYQLSNLVHQYLHVEVPDNADPVDTAISVLEEAIRDHGTAGALETRGVEEGRRQRDEEIRASAFASAREAAEEAGFAPVPESVTVSYEAAAARLMPEPKGRICAVGCGHHVNVHRDAGCDAWIGDSEVCPCPAPYGRILPSDEASTHRRGEDCPTCGASGDDRD